MHIAIRASTQQKIELLEKGFAENVVIEWIEESERFDLKDIDAFFDLLFDDINLNNNFYINDVPVFVNAVNRTCAFINQKNYIKINAWPGFINRFLIEIIICNEEFKTQAELILNALSWNFVWINDDIGFVSARIIAMIINEAFFALEENVSSKEQIDVAMKLGTNYPFGPFEWSAKIGIKNIYNLLKNLCLQNTQYTICDLLKQTAEEES